MKVIIIFGLLVSLCGCSLGIPEAKVSVEVLDESGTRLNNADIVVTFENKNGEIRRMGVSNTNLLFEAQAHVVSPFVSVSVTKAGYYQSRTSCMFKSRSSAGTKMLPWNPTLTVVMRKQLDQKDMVVEFVELQSAPIFGKPVGYDLEAKDWVAPYGRGKFSDFIFNILQLDNGRVSEYSISFNSNGDGIQEYIASTEINSIYKWPYQAPLSGYVRFPPDLEPVVKI
jgi:hypothetical protein